LFKLKILIITYTHCGILLNVKARSHLRGVAKLSAAKIAIQLQLLPLSCILATLHKALIYFTEQKLTENEAFLRSAKIKSEQAFLACCTMYRLKRSYSSFEPDVVCSASVTPLQHRSCSVCVSFVRLGHT